MKNNGLTTMLLAVLAVSAIWSVILCLQFISNNRELRTLQGRAMALQAFQQRAAVDEAVLREAVAYSTNHPAILPILETVGVRKAAPAPVLPAAAVAPQPAKTPTR